MYQMQPLHHSTRLHGSAHDANSNAFSCLHVKETRHGQKQSSSQTPEGSQSGGYLILGHEGPMHELHIV